MFTGIIKNTVLVLSVESLDRHSALNVARPSDWTDLEVGESISVDGACLTIERFDSESIQFYVSPETLAKTQLGYFEKGQVVNLERSLRLADRIGGHLVTGHVDGSGEISAIAQMGEGVLVSVKLPARLMVWLIEKGSIAINGVSLTVNEKIRERNEIACFLIPETLKRTNLSRLKPGNKVNIECDQIVKVIADQISRCEVNREYSL